MTKIQFINPLFEALGWDIREKKKKLNDNSATHQILFFIETSVYNIWIHFFLGFFLGHLLIY
jgi:hypothetical protein